MLSLIFPIAFAAVLSNPTPDNQNPSNEEIIYYLHQQFLEDAPAAYQVASCESTLRQFTKDGTPVTSSTKDYGLMQVNGPSWDKTAHKLGLDYKHSWRDNILMAKVIYENAGKSFKDWSCKKVI